MSYKKQRDKIIWDKLKQVYKGMKSRCNNNIRYTSRGIIVCAKWRAGFIYFYADSKPAFERWLEDQDVLPTIDRIDNDGDYEPDNCRWIDSDGQFLNSEAFGTMEPIEDEHKDLTYKFNNFSIDEVHDHLDKLS